MAFDRVMLFSNADTPICDIPPELIFGATRTEVVNGEHKLAITTTHKLAIGNRLLIQDHTGKWREWVINGIDEQHQNGARQMGTYTGVWSLQYDLTGVQCDKMPGVQSPVSARNALIAALSGTARWTVGTVNVTSTGGASMWQRSAWEALKVLIETWGGEIDATITVGRNGVTARKVDLLQHVGATNVTRRFEYGADLTAIRRKVADGPLYCRVIPLGAGISDGTSQGDNRRRVTIASVNGGVEWLQNDNMVALAKVPDGSGGWEYPTRFVIYDGITDPTELKAKATADLEAQTVPAVTYTASVAQYGEAGVDVTGVNVGDDVHVVDGAFGTDGLRLSARVTKLVTDELNPELSTVTLGSLAATIANNIGAINKQVSALSNYTSRTQTTMADFMSNLLEEINGRVNATGGWSYLIPGRGLVTYDVEIEDLSDDSAASQVTEIRGGTLRFANTRDQAGNWEYKTVLVSGHIATELITAGHITAGYIGDPNGDFWDLDNHELRISGGATVAGTTAQTLVNTANSALSEVNSLDQTEIFNRLTNNGQEQGIFLDNGRLYLNADYMNAGAIGNVSSGNYWDLVTGDMRIASTAQFGNTTVEGALSGISAAMDGNIIPYTANMDTTHGWTRSNATLSGGSSGVIESNTSGTLDWAHRIASPEFSLSEIWNKQVTFSFDAMATGGTASLRIEIDVYRQGSMNRFAWNGPADVSITTTNARKSYTGTFGSSTGWSFTDSTDNVFEPTDRARFIIYCRTLNRSVTLSKWKLQFGSTATAWTPAAADSSSNAALHTLTQTDVFNRLTNDGALQGLYMSGGNLYVNASYIRAGSLSAALITSGKLTSANGQSYFDLDNNLIRLGTSSTNYTTIDATGQIKSANSSGSYYGTVSAGADASGVLGQRHYLTYGGYVYGAIMGHSVLEGSVNVPTIDLIALKYDKRVTIAAFYAMTDAQKKALFDTQANQSTRLMTSPSRLSYRSYDHGYVFEFTGGALSISTQSWIYTITNSGPNFQTR